MIKKDYYLKHDEIHDEEFWEVWCLTFEDNIEISDTYMVRTGYFTEACKYVDEYEQRDKENKS